MTLRVLHCPTAVGGHPGNLARAERSLGLQSVAISLEPTTYAYEVDETVRQPGDGRLRFELRRWALVLRALRSFDVVHFNFGRTIAPPYGAAAEAGFAARAYVRATALADLRALRRAGKVIAVTFQGDDARQGAIARARYDASVATEVPHAYAGSTDEQRRRTVGAFDRYADLVYYLNPDLAHALPARATFLPYASVDLDAWRPVASRSGAAPLVVHAPSDRAIKGTQYVLDAVRTLQEDGVRFRFRLVEGLARDEARRVYEEADVVVDQLVVGWYGGVAVEAMALGKPVIAFIREDDLDVVPGAMCDELPLVRADRESVADALRELVLASPETRTELGRRGRAYVERWHNPLEIARRVERDYAGSRSARH